MTNLTNIASNKLLNNYNNLLSDLAYVCSVTKPQVYFKISLKGN